MDKLDFFRDSRSVPNRDLPHFGVGVKYFQPKRGKTILSWQLAI
jgi:hypothetical protein